VLRREPFPYLLEFSQVLVGQYLMEFSQVLVGQYLMEFS